VAWVLRLVKIDAEGDGQATDVLEIEWPGDLADIADLDERGLTLAETKRAAGWPPAGDRRGTGQGSRRSAAVPPEYTLPRDDAAAASGGAAVVAARQGCRRAVDLALLLSHRLFAVPAVAPVVDRATQRLAASVLERLEHTAEPPAGPYLVTRFHWRLRERWCDRVYYAARTLFTPRAAHYRRLPLPPALRWLHVPLKLPWDFVLTAALSLGRYLRRNLA
jgi:hypothetical protein